MAASGGQQLGYQVGGRELIDPRPFDPGPDRPAFQLGRPLQSSTAIRISQVLPDTLRTIRRRRFPQDRQNFAQSIVASSDHAVFFQLQMNSSFQTHR